MDANRLAKLLAMALTASFIAGCGKSQQTQTSKAPPSTPSGEQTALEQSLSAWSSGDQTRAVDQFVQIDWTKGKPFSSGSVLHYTEAEFAALPPDTRTKLAGQMTAEIASLKELARHVSQQGR